MKRKLVTSEQRFVYVCVCKLVVVEMISFRGYFRAQLFESRLT